MLTNTQFMAFKDLPKYHHNGFFKKIEPLDPNKPIQPGDKFRNSMEIGTFEAVIKVRAISTPGEASAYDAYDFLRRTLRHASHGPAVTRWCSSENTAFASNPARLYPVAPRSRSMKCSLGPSHSSWVTIWLGDSQAYIRKVPRAG